MSTFISQDTDQPVPIVCRFCETGTGKKFYDEPTRVAAIRLRGQWEGGDLDERPHWVPVCWLHDQAWNEEGLDEKYLLPKFDLETWWVAVDRDHHKDMLIGPYPDEDSAQLAMNESLLVQGEVEEDCIDCYVTKLNMNIPLARHAKMHDIVLVDLDEPTYTGKES